MSEIPIPDLDAIFKIEDAKERKQQLIERGLLLQRAEARNDEERDLCDWFLRRGWE